MESFYTPFVLLATYTAIFFLFLQATIKQTPRLSSFHRCLPSVPHVLLDVFLLTRTVFFALMLHIALSEEIVFGMPPSMTTQIVWTIGSGAIFLATADALRRSWFKASRLAYVWRVTAKVIFFAMGSAVILAYVAETTSAVLPYTIEFPAPPYVYFLIVLLYMMSFVIYGAITILICIAAILVNWTSIYWLSVATVLPRLHEYCIYLELYETESSWPFFIFRVGGEVAGIVGVSLWSSEFVELCSRPRTNEDRSQADERTPLLEDAHD